MRILTNNRTIQPLVVSLENSGDLDKNCGNLLVYDSSGKWREKLVMIDNPSVPMFKYFRYQASNLVKLKVETAGAVGIDLGASYSCVGIFRDGEVEIIPNDLGKKITPSYIAFRDHPTRRYRVETLIGEAAKDEVKFFGKC